MKRKHLAMILVSLVIILCVAISYFYKHELSGTKNSKPIGITSRKKDVSSNTQSNNVSSGATTSNKYTNTTAINTKSNSIDTKVNTNNKQNNISSKVQASSNNSNQNICEEVKTNAESLNWSKRFLNQVDIKNMYKKYIAGGGNSNNVQDFAKYITSNAPAQNNWQELFEEDYYDLYGKKPKIVKFVYLGNDLYQAYINQNGSQVPFVEISSKTGYFHG